jgi:hypothetical protein
MQNCRTEASSDSDGREKLIQTSFRSGIKAHCFSFILTIAFIADNGGATMTGYFDLSFWETDRIELDQLQASQIVFP